MQASTNASPPNVTEAGRALSAGLAADGLSDDPAARRRELRVVLALCAAQARGARERATGGSALTLVRDLGTSPASSRVAGAAAPLLRDG